MCFNVWLMGRGTIKKCVTVGRGLRSPMLKLPQYEKQSLPAG